MLREVAPPNNVRRIEDDATPHQVAEPGAFPFPVPVNGFESRQLAWIRNHANYLAGNGLLDYLRAVATVIRGLVLNALILAPYLILLASGIAALSITGWGFRVAAILTGIALAWIAVSPIAARAWHVGRLQRTTTTGSTSSIVIRDRFEGGLGLVFLVIGGVAVCEALSYMVDDFHYWTRERGLGRGDVASGGAVATGILGAGARLVTSLAGAKRKIATAVIGFIGLATPLFAVMLLADYLVYERPGRTQIGWVSKAGWGFWWVVAFAMLVGLWRRAFSRRFKVLAIAGLMVGLGALGYASVQEDELFVAEEERRQQLANLDFTLGSDLLVGEASTNESAGRADEVEELAYAVAGVGPAAMHHLVDQLDAWWLGADEAVQEPADKVLAAFDFPAAADDGQAGLSEQLSASPEFFARIDPDLTGTDVYLDAAAAYRADDPDMINRLAGLDPFMVDLGGIITVEEFFVGNCALYRGSARTLQAQLELFDRDARRIDSAYDLVAIIDFALDFGLLDEVSSTDFACLESELLRLRHRFEFVAPMSLALDSIEDEDDFADGEGLLVLEALRLFDERILNAYFPIDRFDFELLSAQQAYFGEPDPADFTEDELYDLELDAEEQGIRDVLYEGPFAQAFPVLSRNFFEEFDAVQLDLYFLSRDVRDLRIAAAEEVVFSTRYKRLRQTDGVKAIRWHAFRPSIVFGLMLAAIMWMYAWVAIDPNRTSFQALYRDRLATAFLVGPHPNRPGWVSPEPDIDLIDLSRYELGSTAPYHLVNCAVNLPASSDITIRDRKSDFFIFSKWFTGSKVTGYCRSEALERVYPDLSISTAMAISAAAAGPNMGRSTSRALAAFMVLLNVRLGSWVPNPGLLEAATDDLPRPERPSGGFSVEEVMAFERNDLARRWQQLPDSVAADRAGRGELLGLAFSGGGIRSATLNMGIAQALDEAGVFRHGDDRSTVSGGGYLGASISVSMRSPLPTRSPHRGTAATHRDEQTGDMVLSLVEEQPSKLKARCSALALSIVGRSPGSAGLAKPVRYRYPASVELSAGGPVAKGETLVPTALPTADAPQSVAATPRQPQGEGNHQWVGAFGHQFHWRARPAALLREFAGMSNEKQRLVNVSDGGHIENLATIELLRRECKLIIVGDGEMDPDHEFNGLTILLRAARVELGVEIKIDLDPLRLNDQGFASRHWAIGKITYGPNRTGYLLYLKSSITDDEPEDIRGYRAKSPLFPHESTADQFFDEGQFESYRLLGHHIARGALTGLNVDAESLTYADIESWLEELWVTGHPGVETF